jgi:hypothetical protein
VEPLTFLLLLVPSDGLDLPDPVKLPELVLAKGGRGWRRWEIGWERPLRFLGR